MRRSLAVTIVLLFTAANAAQAAPKLGIGAFLGYQGYAMDDVNQSINEINANLSSAGSPVSLDELKGDISFGAALRVDADPAWRVYLEFEHLDEHTGGGNLAGSLQFDPRADGFLAGVTHFFPSTGKARVGLGAGVGYYTFSGTADGNVTIGTTTLAGSQDIGGNTFGYHARGDLDVALSPKMHFDLALGYRWAKGEMELDGAGTGEDLDWSGVMTRLGLTYFLK
jgi:hypothetical protein